MKAVAFMSGTSRALCMSVAQTTSSGAGLRLLLLPPPLPGKVIPQPVQFLFGAGSMSFS